MAGGRPTNGVTRQLLCAQCGGGVAPSHTRGVSERLLKAVVRIRAYRCLSCQHRFFASRRHRDQLLHR